MQIVWNNVGAAQSFTYTCGYCGNHIASDRAYNGILKQPGSSTPYFYKMYICHSCNRPTFFDQSNKQSPGAPFGRYVNGLTSKEVEDLYNESRECMKVSAYTASVMCSRKILMNIAVDKGAEVGNTYAYYVDYLVDKGYVPPGSKTWVDIIREKGNEANHGIEMKSKEDAEQLISFVEMILKFIYEFPSLVKKKDDDVPVTEVT